MRHLYPYVLVLAAISLLVGPALATPVQWLGNGHWSEFQSTPILLLLGSGLLGLVSLGWRRKKS